jgi:hypothetical protein
MTTKLATLRNKIIRRIRWLPLAATLQAGAASADLGFVAGATAEDRGPQDGVFDAFTPSNFGSVDNNGFTSLRTDLEFNLSPIPVGSTVSTATLSVHIGFVEGTRSLVLNGYAGDGAIQLIDFSRDGLVGSAILAGTSHDLMFDATGFIRGLIGGGNVFAGFNFREDPANIPNFTIFNIDMTGPAAPLLSINFVPVPEPSAIWPLAIGLIILIIYSRGLRRSGLTNASSEVL